ncbi:hypothetical protein QR680_002894 [Steinernema hermaphroditum]|uniref:Uncharacterized protein n=1 Tax=Steinernema hermaphroditum TaxID=289476 RepID=A0AA39H6C1_9BILA|nr:hypothetical protein QR680_002894 [Steinernema hermaphroditum]
MLFVLRDFSVVFSFKLTPTGVFKLVARCRRPRQIPMTLLRSGRGLIGNTFRSCSVQTQHIQAVVSEAFVVVLVVCPTELEFLKSF